MLEEESYSQKEYKKQFGLDSPQDIAKARRALAHALDIRKFEISLYWQRATYSWTLIAAAFAGYFAVQSADHMKHQAFNAYVIACIGLIFSLAWFLTNRGSKYWQENWENHVDMLEDRYTGPLYKTILHRRDPDWRKLAVWKDRRIIWKDRRRILEPIFKDPGPFSVSQINQWVSLFTVVVWLLLIVSDLLEFGLKLPVTYTYVVVGYIAVLAVTAGAVWLLVWETRSNVKKGHDHVMEKKPTRIADK